jgi:hypothetical protein
VSRTAKRNRDCARQDSGAAPELSLHVIEEGADASATAQDGSASPLGMGGEAEAVRDGGAASTARGLEDRADAAQMFV